MSEQTPAINVKNGNAQILKTELLAMIESGTDPFDIIRNIAEYLEKISDEPGYAQNIINNLRTVYGHIFGETKLLEDELEEIESRCHRIEAALKNDEFNAEEKARITLAINLHHKNAARLKAEIDALKEKQNSSASN